VFVRSGGVWTNQTGLIIPDILTGSVGQQVALSASGDYLAFGAPSDDSDGSNNGAVYTMTRSGTVWSRPSRLRVLDSAMASSRWLGRSLSMSAAGTLVVSTHTELPMGAWWSETQQEHTLNGMGANRRAARSAFCLFSFGPFFFFHQAL
jgi:hypothetical protein